MASTDSVSLFAEGTFYEQMQELVEYISRSRPESDRASFKQPLDDSLKSEEGQKPLDEDSERKARVVSRIVNAIDSVGDGSDREIEGFFNLVFSHLFDIFPLDSPELSKSIDQLLAVISSEPNHASTKYRVLSNLFNVIPRTSAARLRVCKTLIKLAAENDEVDTLQLSPPDVDRWLSEWNASSEEKIDFLKTVVDTFLSVKQPESAYSYFIPYVRSLPASSPAAKPASLQLIASALQLPTVFDFDSLLKLENVQAQSSHELYHLLTIFNKESLSTYKSWVEKNTATLEEYGLAESQLERKLRLLTLAELGFSKIGQSLSYAEIASAIQIEKSDVEKWVIDVIRAGLLYGKLSQTTQTLVIVRASPRGFSTEEWNVLEQRLVAWKTGLTGIQSVLASARQSFRVDVGDRPGLAQEQVV